MSTKTFGAILFGYIALYLFFLFGGTTMWSNHVASIELAKWDRVEGTIVDQPRIGGYRALTVTATVEAGNRKVVTAVPDQAQRGDKVDVFVRDDRIFRSFRAGQTPGDVAPGLGWPSAVLLAGIVIPAALSAIALLSGPRTSRRW